MTPRTHVPLVHKKKEPKPKSRLTRGGRIKPVSAKMAKISKIYRALKLEFLQKHPVCEFFLSENGLRLEHIWVGTICRVADTAPCMAGFIAPRSTECHHRRGRGKYMLDVSTWLAVSSQAHRYIHDNVAESYAKGYMLPRT